IGRAGEEPLVADDHLQDGVGQLDQDDDRLEFFVGADMKGAGGQAFAKRIYEMAFKKAEILLVVAAFGELFARTDADRKAHLAARDPENIRLGDGARKTVAQ